MIKIRNIVIGAFALFGFTTAVILAAGIADEIWDEENGLTLMEYPNG